MGSGGGAAARRKPGERPGSQVFSVVISTGLPLSDGFDALGFGSFVALGLRISRFDFFWLLAIVQFLSAMMLVCLIVSGLFRFPVLACRIARVASGLAVRVARRGRCLRGGRIHGCVSAFRRSGFLAGEAPGLSLLSRRRFACGRPSNARRLFSGIHGWFCPQFFQRRASCTRGKSGALLESGFAIRCHAVLPPAHSGGQTDYGARDHV